MSRRVQEILSWYESDCPGTVANLRRMLCSGTLAGTGNYVKKSTLGIGHIITTCKLSILSATGSSAAAGSTATLWPEFPD